KPDVEVLAAQALKATHLLAIRAIQPTITQPMFAEQLKTLAANLQRELDEAKVVLPAQATLPAQQSAATPSPASTLGKEVVNAHESQPSDVELPNTPAGKVMGKFLKALNSGDLATMKKFHKEFTGDEENAEKDIGLYQQSGGLKPHSVTRSAEFEIEIIAQAKNDGHW